MALNERDQAIYDAIIASNVLPDATVSELMKYPDTLGHYAVMLHRMRAALNKQGYPLSTLVTMQNMSDKIDAISGIDKFMKANGFSQEFADAYSEILDRQNVAVDGLTEYGKNTCYNNSRSGIVFAPKLPINGSMENCFNGCVYLTSISSDLNLGDATELRNTFNNTNMFPTNITINCTNLKSVYMLGGNFQEITFTNCSNIKSLEYAFRTNHVLKKLHGINLSNTSSNHAWLFDCYVEHIDFEGITFNENDEVVIDANVKNYFRSEKCFMTNKDAFPLSNVDNQTLRSIVYLAYDWITNPDELTRSTSDLLIFKYYTSCWEKLQNGGYNVEELKQLLRDKGWTVA